MVVYKATKYNTIEPLPDLDVYTFLFKPNEFNLKFPADRKVVIDGHTGRSLTHSQVRDLSSRMAAGWVNKVGLKKGDIVASFAPNQYDHIVVYLSLLAAKCTVTPGNPMYTEAEFQHQISNSGAKALITVPELLPVLLKVCARVGIPKDRIFLYGEKDHDGLKSVYSVMASVPEGRHIEYPVQGLSSKEDVAFICYSSGTTGLAKGVMLTHQNLIAQALITMETDKHAHNELDMTLCFLPLYHIYGLTVLCFNAFYKLLPVVIIPKFELKTYLELVQKYRITLLSIVPPVAVQLAKDPLVLKYDLTSVRIIQCGAAPLGKEHTDNLLSRIPGYLIQSYGMTETTSAIIQSGYDGTAIGSVGIVCPSVECKIVDEQGNELGDDQEGEILVRGPSIMKGYYNNPEANAKTFTKDGWMKTGDVVKFDSAKQEFFVMDRLKELIKVKGFQVAPAELESLLLGMSEVNDCCVIGVYSSEEATEYPRAYVVRSSITAKDDDATLAKRIEEFVAKNVTGYKKLRGGVYFLDQIPKSPSGKILRRRIRELAKEQDKAEKLPAKL
ncbi:hypothetical protein BDB00DRAFT_968219 [Zychaea mexicana]|uniref:uncharacterized protein n=1 Tax=Zychaea mexicana TaxID=64656 RepID=UPI0022FDD3F3|nr:uncharacterized protein BDB00DRAFT_968219 [Zychaea mexicana]KAI9498552.1 hypothetical protein BDB00DRAFT_968219 [Zychaea mexicana]